MKPGLLFQRTLRWVLLSMLSLTALLPSAAAVNPPTVLQIEVRDTLQPERARVFAQQVESANRDGCSLIVVNLSTPGGLSDSVDRMVETIRHSGIPVVVWVGSAQSRVSGEGLRLLAEADLSLMNQQAFLTPLWTDRVHGYTPAERTRRSHSLQEHLERANQAHGRGTGSLDELTSGTHWFTAAEAVQTGLVDGRAARMQDVLLLASSTPFHGRDGLNRRPATDLRNAQVSTAHVNLQQLLLLTLMNPDLCVLLLTLGMLLIYLEINTPGAVVPGAAGVLLVLLAAYALHQLPLNTSGIFLCIVAALLLLLESPFAAHGVLAALGVASLIAGLGNLVHGPIPQMQVGWSTATGAGLGFGGVTASLILLGIEARRAKVKTGSDALLGWLAVAQTALAPSGLILVRGELWKARLAGQESFLSAGARVKVLRADDSVLEVAAVPLTDGE